MTDPDLTGDLPIKKKAKQKGTADLDSLKQAADVVQDKPTASKPARGSSAPTTRQEAPQEPVKPPAQPTPPQTSAGPVGQTTGNTKGLDRLNLGPETTPPPATTSVKPPDPPANDGPQDPDPEKSVPMAGRAVPTRTGPIPPEILAKRQERMRTMKRG